MQLVMADIYPVRSWKNITVVGKRRWRSVRCAGCLAHSIWAPEDQKDRYPVAWLQGPPGRALCWLQSRLRAPPCTRGPRASTETLPHPQGRGGGDRPWCYPPKGTGRIEEKSPQLPRTRGTCRWSVQRTSGKREDRGEKPSPTKPSRHKLNSLFCYGFSRSLMSALHARQNVKLLFSITQTCTLHWFFFFFL